MAIPAQSVSYRTAGPVFTGQVLAPSNLSMNELSFVGTATFTGDGSLTTATLNYIDGTNVLPFVPAAVVLVRIGGTAAATIVAYAVDNADGGKTAAVTFSAAPANASTFICAIFIVK